MIPSKGTYGLSLEERTLPQVLKETGYRTAMVGKWHLGHADQKYWPRQRGFDYHYGAVICEIDYFTRESHGALDWQRDNQAVREEGYVTQILGADAVRVINQQDAKIPLFLYLAFTAAHSPYQAPKEYVDRYAHIADISRRTYAGQITCMDDEIGKVLAALEQKQMRDNTLIIFHSNNGGTKSKMFAGEGDVSKVNIPCDNGTLNGGKGQLYEGGTRVPALANWPGKLKPGEMKGLVHITDLLPTLASLAGGSTAVCKPLDGYNVWPAIAEGQPSARTEVVYNVEPFNAALRQGDWKLLWKAVLPSKVELFNHAEDPNEQTNLATREPEKVKALQTRIEQLAAESAKPLFMKASLDAIYGGLFGPAPIPMEEEAASGN